MTSSTTCDGANVPQRGVQRVLEASARATLDAAMSEAEWQRQVIAYAEANHWTCWHDADPRRDYAGFPDLLLVGDRVIFAELKRVGGRVRPVQRWFLDLLRAAGAEVYIWFPTDFDEVQRVLEQSRKEG